MQTNCIHTIAQFTTNSETGCSQLRTFIKIWLQIQLSRLELEDVALTRLRNVSAETHACRPTAGPSNGLSWHRSVSAGNHKGGPKLNQQSPVQPNLNSKVDRCLAISGLGLVGYPRPEG